MLKSLRGWVFLAQMYCAMLVLGLVFLPWAALSRRGAVMACKSFCAWTQWTLRLIVGLKTEVRGPVPEGAVLVAAKHQSFLDIVMLYHALPRAKFIMKRALVFTPVIGLYALRIGCVPVNRGKRGKAIAKMLDDVARGAAEPGQLVIYPQGTRVAPGAQRPYKVGAGVLYEQTGQACVPVATNAGVFWPRKGAPTQSGTAVIEFLATLPAGSSREAMLSQLESGVEAASEALLQEADLHASH